MGNDIGTGLSLRAVCFDFRSTNVGSSVIGTSMFSTADLEIKNVPNPLRPYHLSAICPEDI